MAVCQMGWIKNDMKWVVSSEIMVFLLSCIKKVKRLKFKIADIIYINSKCSICEKFTLESVCFRCVNGCLVVWHSFSDATKWDRLSIQKMLL